ncbi:hypothetical protein SeLEV6574_g06270 [Synchytrium endobioticum]|uniref:Secreted protein n=1 Tax=Synchytrium endobioticum TaxID=286115 RepID=A0A507CPK4_9FUNG|nr:hypothetical protein SeLEV6574_g06270 [Synchytrium endobioticum]
MKIKSIVYLMFVCSLLVSHVIGSPMNRHGSNQGSTKAAVRAEKIEEIEKWMEQTFPGVPKPERGGMSKLDPDISYSTWKEQLYIAQNLFDKLKTREMAKEVYTIIDPMFAAYFGCIAGAPGDTTWSLVLSKKGEAEFLPLAIKHTELVKNVVSYQRRILEPLMKTACRMELGIHLARVMAGETMLTTQYQCLVNCEGKSDEELRELGRLFKGAPDNFRTVMKMWRDIAGTTQPVSSDVESDCEPSTSYRLNDSRNTGKAGRTNRKTKSNRKSGASTANDGHDQIQSIRSAQDRNLMRTSSSDSLTAPHHPTSSSSGTQSSGSSRPGSVVGRLSQ